MVSLKHLLNNQTGEDDCPDSIQALGCYSSIQYPRYAECLDDEPVIPHLDDGAFFNELFGQEIDFPDVNFWDLNFHELPSINFDDGFEHVGTETDTSMAAAIRPATTGTYSEHDSQKAICYGMLYRVAVRLKGDMMTLSQKLSCAKTRGVPGHAVLEISRREEPIQVTFPDGTEFAQVNAHVAKVLRGVVDVPSMSQEVLVDLISFRQAIERATKAVEATMRVQINMYGLPNQIDVVGRILSEGKCFLQDPDYPRPEVAYRNPHMFVFQDNEIAADGNTTKGNDAGSSLLSEPKQDVREAVEDIFASLERRTHLKMIAGASSLKTDLLTHQQEALDFLTQREAGPIPPEYRLWKMTRESEQECFRHTITGAVKPHGPNEGGGGVLADAMGLGKTLTILALIARTTDEARRWQTAREAPEAFTQ